MPRNHNSSVACKGTALLEKDKAAPSKLIYFSLVDNDQNVYLGRTELDRLTLCFKYKYP